MSHITQIFLSKLPVNPLAIHKFLILLHEDDTGDVYINDFNETALVKFKEPHDLKIGDRVPLKNISDIEELRFPDIKIHPKDAIIYCIRTDWRFSLYYDFGRNLDEKTLYKELGKLTREARFHTLLSSAESEIDTAVIDEADCVIFTEGKTDVKHLIKAYDKLKIETPISFWDREEGDKAGSDDLIKMCEHFSKLPQRKKTVFVFDRDDKKIIDELNKKKTVNGFQYWGNNTYSFYLPVPTHRGDEKHAISIEFFYEDKDLLRKDGNGRRLYLSDEFDSTSGKHQSESTHCMIAKKFKGDRVHIIDSEVFDDKKSVALSKDAFATLISNEEGDFKDTDFSEFKKIYDIIDQIVAHKPTATDR
jgi:hypothetical protein